MANQWSVNKSSVDMVALYRKANERGAMETASSDYWTAFWENVIKTSGKSLRMKPQAPPTDDPDSDFMLRRIDFSIDGYSTNGRRFALVFAEVKRASASLSLYQEVERQAQGACETYLDETQDSDVHLVYAMRAVGTRCRLFRYAHDPDEEDVDWEPMWGENTEPDPRYYIDGNDEHNGRRILEALHQIFTRPPARLADASYLLVDTWLVEDSALMVAGRPMYRGKVLRNPRYSLAHLAHLARRHRAPLPQQSSQAFDAYMRLRNQRYSHEQCVTMMAQTLQRTSPGLDLQSARSTVQSRIQAGQARANASRRSS